MRVTTDPYGRSMRPFCVVKSFSPSRVCDVNRKVFNDVLEPVNCKKRSLRYPACEHHRTSMRPHTVACGSSTAVIAFWVAVNCNSSLVHM